MVDKLPVDLIIDVREPNEFQAGHAVEAINIPLGQIQQSGNKLLGNTDKDSRIVLYCRSGSRSSMAINILEQQGFKHLINGIDSSNTDSKYYLQTDNI